MVHEKFNVTGMTCGACQAHVNRAVSRLPGVSTVAVNLLSGSMAVDYDETQLSAEDICTAVDRAGYGATPADAATAIRPRRAFGVPHQKARGHG